MLTRQRTIIIASIIGILIIALAVAGIMVKRPAANTSSTYYDKNSGDTVIENNQSQQGSDASLANSTIWLGFSTLLDRGLSPDQIQSIQTTIKKYALQQNSRFKEVSLTVASYRHTLPKSIDDPTHVLAFDITVNRTDAYHVSVSYTDTQSCVTSLYTSDQKTLLIQQ